jgi:hypothetical protein
MQHLPETEIAKRIVREKICPDCDLRAPGSDGQPLSFARSCEAACAVFLHMDDLLRIAANDGGPRVGRYELKIRDQICNHSCSEPTHGDYCQKALNVTCPLARFMGQIIAELQTLPRSDAAKPSH